MVGRNDPHGWRPECPWGAVSHSAVRLAFLDVPGVSGPSANAMAATGTAEPPIRRVTRLSWACSFTGVLIFVSIVSWLLAIHARVITDGSSGRIPLASAPAGLLIVALAFGIATWVGDILPAWIQSDRQPHDPSVPLQFPIAGWCHDCRRQFVDPGPGIRTMGNPSQEVPRWAGRVPLNPTDGSVAGRSATDQGLDAPTQAARDLN